MDEQQAVTHSQNATSSATTAAAASPDQTRWNPSWRTGLAAALFVLAATYVVLVVAIPIPAARRLGTVELALLLVAALAAAAILNPEMLKDVKSFQGWGWRFELREELRQTRQDLDAIRFVLMAVISDWQRIHLRNLSEGSNKTAHYKGHDALRKDLRALRDLGLIYKKPGRRIGEFKDGVTLDLSEIVALTNRGREYLERINRYESDSDVAAPKAAA